MFYFEPNFIEKFLWERDFSNFGHLICFRETKISFLTTLHGCLRCIQVWYKFRTEIPTEKYLKMLGSRRYSRKEHGEVRLTA